MHLKISRSNAAASTVGLLAPLYTTVRGDTIDQVAKRRAAVPLPFPEKEARSTCHPARPAAHTSKQAAGDEAPDI